MNKPYATIVLIGLLMLAPTVLAKSNLKKMQGSMTTKRATAGASTTTAPASSKGPSLSQTQSPAKPELSGTALAKTKGEGLKLGIAKAEKKIEEKKPEPPRGKKIGYLGKATGKNARLTTVGRRRS